jgi:hypothetical protein
VQSAILAELLLWGEVMEVKGAPLLYTLAALMITFAGFSALLLAVRQAAGAKLS